MLLARLLPDYWKPDKKNRHKEPFSFFNTIPLYQLPYITYRNFNLDSQVVIAIILD